MQTTTAFETVRNTKFFNNDETKPVNLNKATDIAEELLLNMNKKFKKIYKTDIPQPQIDCGGPDNSVDLYWSLIVNNFSSCSLCVNVCEDGTYSYFGVSTGHEDLICKEGGYDFEQVPTELLNWIHVNFLGKDEKPVLVSRKKNSKKTVSNSN